MNKVPKQHQRLDQYVSRLDRGRAYWVEALWIVIQSLLFSSFLPGSRWRVLLLRLFGAQVGREVVIKPGVRIKFPWRLAVGDHSWIGEAVWIDNLAQVSIGAHCCISQGAYLCTGGHDWRNSEFSLVTQPIQIEDGVWVAARAMVAPGVHIGAGAVLGLGSVATGNLDAGWVYLGVPAQPVKQREIKTSL